MTKKKKKTKTKSSKWSNFKKILLKVIDFFKLVYGKIKEFFSKKSVQIGLSVLLLVMFMLGFNAAWQCGSKGWNCKGNYTPPEPEDVNKIIRPIGSGKK